MLEFLLIAQSTRTRAPTSGNDAAAPDPHSSTRVVNHTFTDTKKNISLPSTLLQKHNIELGPGVVIDVRSKACQTRARHSGIPGVEDNSLHTAETTSPAFAPDFCPPMLPSFDQLTPFAFYLCVRRPKLSGIRALAYGTSLCGARSRCVLLGALNIIPHGACIRGREGGGCYALSH